MAALRKLLCLVMAAMLLLTGCGVTLSFTGGNVEELLRAPQPGAVQSAVQKALNLYLGETAQLKYPRGGAEMSPLLFADLDGDGADEAALLYQSQSKGQNVHLAILENKETGWEVVYELEGLSSEVANVERAALTGSGVQLVVGYANATLTDPYLSVYDYHDETLLRLHEQSYTQHLVADVDGTGTDELLMVSQSAQPGALTLQLLAAPKSASASDAASPVAAPALTLVQAMELDARFVACKGLYVSVSTQRRGVVVDGLFSGGALASQVLRLTENGTLTLWPPAAEVDVPRRSQRYLNGLYATDFSGKGTVEVPTGIASAPTLTSARRFYFVTWQDFLSGDPEAYLNQTTLPENARFGVYDSTYGYFVRLPSVWRGEVNLVDGLMPGEWNLRSKQGNALLLSARVADATKPLGLYTPVGTLGEQSVQIMVTDNCSAAEAQIVLRGVTVM